MALHVSFLLNKYYIFIVLFCVIIETTSEAWPPPCGLVSSLGSVRHASLVSIVQFISYHHSLYTVITILLYRCRQAISLPCGADRPPTPASHIHEYSAAPRPPGADGSGVGCFGAPPLRVQDTP